MFDINQANVETKCRNCGGIIPAKTKKLRFTKLLGANTVSGSLCRKCFTKLATELLGHATAYGDKILFCLVEDDAQAMAEKLIGRRLTEEELYSVEKGLEWGLGDYSIVLETAIKEAVEE